MSTMTFDKLAYVDRLKAAGFNEPQARALADGLDQALREEVATKGDIAALRNEIGLFRVEVKSEIGELRGEMDAFKSAVKGEMDVLKSTLRGEMDALRSALRGEMDALKG
jgi:hypothetical protein